MTLRNLTFSFLVLLGWCLPAGAALPLGLPLEAPEVVLHLFSAELDVQVVPNQPPFLVVESLAEEGQGGAVEVEQGLATITARRLDEDPNLRLRFRLTLRPEQRLRVEGDDVTAVLDARTIPPALSPQDPGAGPIYLLQLNRSQVQLLAVSNLLLSGSGNWVRGDGTAGPLAFNLIGGSAELHGHKGGLRLESEGAELFAEGVEGDLQVVAKGGSFEVRQGTGQLRVEANGAALRLAGWKGPSHLTVDAASLETQDCDGNPFEVLATGSELRLEGQRGQLGARLEGGSLLLSGMEGETTLEGRAEAQVTVTDYAGALVLLLEGGAGAGVKNLVGTVRTRVEDGRLVLAGIERLDLTARRSEVVASDIRALSLSELSDGTAELDLTQLTKGPRLSLVGRAQVTVRLPTPCIVKASGAMAFDGNQLTVTGCDHNAPGQGTRTGSLNRAYGGQALVLSVTLDPTAELEVEGRSRD